MLFARRASVKEVGPDLQNLRLPSDGKVKKPGAGNAAGCVTGRSTCATALDSFNEMALFGLGAPLTAIGARTQGTAQGS